MCNAVQGADFFGCGLNDQLRSVFVGFVSWMRFFRIGMQDVDSTRETADTCAMCALHIPKYSGDPLTDWTNRGSRVRKGLR